MMEGKEIQGLEISWILLLLPCFVAPKLPEETLQFAEDYFTFKHARIITCFTCSKYGAYFTVLMFLRFKVFQ
jgi:hypothetical protein